MIALLSLIALALAIYGIVALVHGQLAVGIGSLLAAALVGPGGVSIIDATTTIPF